MKSQALQKISRWLDDVRREIERDGCFLTRSDQDGLTAELEKFKAAVEGKYAEKERRNED